MYTNDASFQTRPRECYVPAGRARLYYREIGQGLPVIVLHGGPDFNCDYLLPDLDRLGDVFRLIYYDQRGRGRSEANVQPEDVTIESEMADLELLREHIGLETAAVLGHSWGGLLAMEYAVRHPQRVSHLILMNSAPASHADLLRFRQSRREKEADSLEKMKALAATPEYAAGDVETEAEYCRYHYGATIRQPELLERVVRSLRLNFTPEGIRKARAIENRLYDQTWLADEYDLLPRLKQLSIPALVIHGGYDFVPRVCAEHIAHAIPGARLAVLADCGHFSYLECPDEVHREIAGFAGQT